MLGVLYVRAIEAADHTWHCRRGLTEFDSHPTLDEALKHLRALCEEESGEVTLEIVAHPLDGPPQFYRAEDLADLE